MAEPQWVGALDGHWNLLLFDRTFAFNKGRLSNLKTQICVPYVSIAGQSGQRCFPVALRITTTEAVAQFKSFCQSQKDLTRRYSETAIQRVVAALEESVRQLRVSEGTITLEEDCELVDETRGMRSFPGSLARNPAAPSRMTFNQTPKPKPTTPLPTPTKRRFKK